jgi:GNAT superfamily N-acetyltransferase
MEYLIRDFQETDVDQLVILCAKHAAHEQVYFNPEGKASRLTKALSSKHPSLHCWVVVVKGQVAGYTSFTFDFSTWDANYYLHLDCIYLEEQIRGLGIGREILKRLLEIARQTKCVNLQWQTPVFNEQAIRFYEQVGATSLTKNRFFIST